MGVCRRGRRMRTATMVMVAFFVVVVTKCVQRLTRNKDRQRGPKTVPRNIGSK
jgi:hypothetical protein